MNPKCSLHVLAIVLVVLAFCFIRNVAGQGSLNPPDSPERTMKSLQEIWDKLGELDTKIDALEVQNTTLTTYLLGLAEDQGMRLDWVIRTLDGITAAENVGEDSSMAIAPNGFPAISYYDRTNGNLMYARFNGSSWSVQTIDTGSGADVGRASSLAFNPDTGYAAISYYDYTSQDLKFAKQDEFGWTKSVVASTGEVGLSSSLAFRSNGYPAIAFFDSTNDRLRLAWWRPDVSGGWQFDTVDDTDIPGRGCSLAVAYNGYPHISYGYARAGMGSGGLRHAWLTVKNWDVYNPVVTTIDSTGPWLDRTSLAFTSDERPAISYFNQITGSVNYAHFDGSAWHIDVVDPAGLVGWGNSLAFTQGGLPAISYHDQRSWDLRYAEYDGSAWRLSTVDSEGSTGRDTSLVFLSNGMPAISYYDSTTGSLEFAELRSYRLLPVP